MDKYEVTFERLGEIMFQLIVRRYAQSNKDIEGLKKEIKEIVEFIGQSVDEKDIIAFTNNVHNTAVKDFTLPDLKPDDLVEDLPIEDAMQHYIAQCVYLSRCYWEGVCIGNQSREVVNEISLLGNCSKEEAIGVYSTTVNVNWDLICSLLKE